MLAVSPMSNVHHWQAPAVAICGSSCRQWYWEVRPWPDTVTSVSAAPAGHYSISLEWPFTGVFKAGRPSTSRTAAHLLQMLPAVSVFVLPAAPSSSFHDTVAASSVIGHSLLSAWWPGTLCLTISMTQCLLMTSLEQHWKHTLSPSIRTCT